jgi:hypothetical protein
MELKFPPTDREILQDISEIDKKIAHLKMIKSFKRLKKVQYFLFAEHSDKSEMFLQLDQTHFPFNLESELNRLINDSIEYLGKTRETLISLLNFDK